MECSGRSWESRPEANDSVATHAGDCHRPCARAPRRDRDECGSAAARGACPRRGRPGDESDRRRVYPGARPSWIAGRGRYRLRRLDHRGRWRLAGTDIDCVDWRAWPGRPRHGRSDRFAARLEHAGPARDRPGSRSDARPNAHSRANRRADRDVATSPGTDSNADTGPHAGSDPQADAGPHAQTNSGTDAQADPDSGADARPYSQAYSSAHARANAGAHANADRMPAGRRLPLGGRPGRAPISRRALTRGLIPAAAGGSRPDGRSRRPCPSSR